MLTTSRFLALSVAAVVVAPLGARQVSGPALSREPWVARSAQPGDLFGAAVASAGDVNGDGYGELAVGAGAYDGVEIGVGRVLVYRGSPQGPSSTSFWSLEGSASGSRFGDAVACVGDVNGDGFSDLMVGAPFFTDGEAQEGAAYLYLGSPTGLSSTPAWSFESGHAGANFGGSVSGAGDVNGDGFADVIVGARLFSQGETDEGRAYVFLGSPMGLAQTPAWVVESNRTGARFGDSVAGAGDIDGDGYDEVLVGSPGWDLGRVFVFRGSPTGLEASAAWTQRPRQSFSASYGHSVAGVGDVNHDGFADVLIGDPHYDLGQSDEGAVFLYHGSAQGLGTLPDWQAESNRSGAEFGYSVAGAGDVNGDTFPDMVVGAWQYPPHGRVYLYFGSDTGFPAAPTQTWRHRDAEDFGFAISGAGDLNGDGYDEVACGAPFFLSNEPGFAYVGYGETSYPPAQAVHRNAGANPDSYVADAPALGGTWTATVDLTTTGHVAAQVFGFSLGGVAFTHLGGQVQLVAGSQVVTLPVRLGPLASWSIPIPNDPSMVGNIVYTQAIHVGGQVPYALSNAQDLTFGS